MKAVKGIQAAIGFLTTLPIPAGIDPRLGIPFFPVLGTLLGGLMALVAYGCGSGMDWHAGGAVLAVVLVTFVTGGLHVDGLADSADACGVQGISEKLRVMRDPHVGSFGVTAIVFSLLFKVVSIQALSLQSCFLWMLLPCALSRAAQVVTLVALPYIRESGKGRTFSDAARPIHAAIAIGWSVALGWVVMNALSFGLIVGVGLVLVLLLLSIKRTYGGITGDLIGAVSELTECTAWGLLVLIGHSGM